MAFQGKVDPAVVLQMGHELRQPAWEITLVLLDLLVLLRTESCNEVIRVDLPHVVALLMLCDLFLLV